MLLLSQYAKPSTEQARDRVDPEHTRVLILASKDKLMIRVCILAFRDCIAGFIKDLVYHICQERDGIFSKGKWITECHSQAWGELVRRCPKGPA